jgi:Domain of unknown function (DUF1330)
MAGRRRGQGLAGRARRRTAHRRLRLATPRRAFRRGGTKGSNPAPSSAESIANLTFGAHSIGEPEGRNPSCSKLLRFEGAPPAPRVVVVQFESLEKLQALYESAPYKQAVAIGDKYATQRIFGVEGVLP